MIGLFIAIIIKINSLDSMVLSDCVGIKSYIDDVGGTLYSPIYYYNVNGENYCGSSSSSNYNLGTQITLYGDSRNDRKLCDEDGLVDLLIDESSPDNYYIDFEINRLSGNLSQD